MALFGCFGGRSKKSHAMKKELMSRTNLETHKLDLMAEISALKLKLATSEKARVDHEQRFQDAQKRIDDLQGRLNNRTIEINELTTRVGKNGTIHSPLETSDGEVERLKKVVESLMMTNTEKDRQIDDMDALLKKYHRLENMLVATQGRKYLEPFGLDDSHSDASSTNPDSSSSNDYHSHQHVERPISGDYPDHHMHPASRLAMPDPSATSTPVSSIDGKPPLPAHQRTSPSVVTSLSFTPRRPSDTPLHRSNSAEDMTPVNSKTPPTVRRNGHGLNYVKTEEDEESLKDEMARQYKALQQTGNGSVHNAPQPDPRTAAANAHLKKQKGFKRFFGRLRRSNSQDMDGEGMESFKRNGLRSTAGPRLGWSKDTMDPELPFARWDGDRVSAWMHSIGLSMYVGECKRWVKNGNQIVQASQPDLEKELGMRNPFHRKKLQLALQSLCKDVKEPVDELDHNWVTRWLDDIGLPQYKDSFLEARIDGRMLHLLTVDDLVCLRITNHLHHLSIKRGIQVLRKHKFNPSVLKRRPVPDEGILSNCPEEVNLWTNHRVMEWLRTIDLSEYAPNLRGSGVHGGLMVLEPRFCAELFASILSIPNSKTLLRRHLSTHFVRLIGNDVQHGKRETEQQPGYVPLTPNQKVKARKFGLFSKQRTRSTSESDDFICPLDGSRVSRDPLDGSRVSREPHKNGHGGMNGSYSRESSLTRPRESSLTRQQSLPRQVQPADLRRPITHDKQSLREIGGVSHEINSLTHMLSQEKFFDDVPSSNV